MTFPAIISDEMRLRSERLPDRLDDPLVANSIIELRSDSFLFTTPAGTRFHYEKGRGIAVDESTASNPEETDLYYHGTVYGAVAWINGLIPLHASSVVRDGRVIAFTADSGEGKSTLAAALSRHGYEHRSDDVLLLERREESLYAWPDRERIKLCRDAFELTGAAPVAPIEPGADKFFANLSASQENGKRREAQHPLPFTDLVFLSSRSGSAPRIESLTGSAKLPLLLKALYRIEIDVGLGNTAAHKSMLTTLARSTNCWKLSRRRSREHFEKDIAAIAILLSGL